MTEATTTPWIEEDFEGIDFKDKRLVKRFKNIVNHYRLKPVASINACKAD